MGNSSALSLSTTEIGMNLNVPLTFKSYYAGTYSALYASTNTFTNFSLLFDPTTTYIGAPSNIIFVITAQERGTWNANGLSIGTGTITQNGALTIKGSGSNILSLRDSSNVEVLSISNGGNLNFLANGGSIYDAYSNQIFSFFYNQVQLRSRFTSGGGYFDGLIPFGGYNSASFPAIKRNGAAIDFRLADDSGYCNITASNITALAGIAAYSTIEGYSSGQSGSFSGSVRVGSGGSNAASAILDVISTTKGFLMPRMTTAQINAIATPANGLQVYNTDLGQPCFYDGAGWRKISHTNM